MEKKNHRATRWIRFGGSVSSRMKFSTISFRNETRVSSLLLSAIAPSMVKARFSNEERHTCACFPRDERKQSFQTKRDGKRYFRRFVLVSLQNLPPFFSLSFFFLSYEHTTRGRFTFEFNNDINFCSLFFFLSSFSFFFYFFLLFFCCCSTLPGVNVEKISDSSFPDPFSPGEKLINGWEKWNGHSWSRLYEVSFPGILWKCMFLG